MEKCESILYGENIQENKSIVVFFHNDDRIGVKQLRNWSENYADSKIIIVSLEGPTAFTKREAEQNYFNIQFFTFKDLCSNITKHALVPKHEVIQKENLKYKVKSDEEWPKLYKNDPIAQYYDFQVGDLIKITRSYGYPETVLFYRLVCHPTTS
tara:strand:- start:1043 stop:1504 length:462 start_codon:yes stop_codon:yes gene_type:complete